MNLNDKDTLPLQPTIAISAKWQTYPDRFHWLRENDFALEYSPNPEELGSLHEHIDSFLQSGTPVRYHAFFPGYEIGHHNTDIRDSAMRFHLAALEAIHRHVEQVITVHIGLNPEDKIEPAAAIENLSSLVELGRDLNITVCLENLRRGPTSHPENLINWARHSGAMITFDVGHAVSSQRVQSGELSTLDFLDSVSDRLCEVHMYERETDRHYPPRDMSVLGPIVDRLLETECKWWTIELDEPAEALATRELLLDYLRTS